MSDTSSPPPMPPRHPHAAAPGPRPQAPKPFKYVHSSGFPELLNQLGATLFVSTYQAGKVMLIRSRAGRLSTLLRQFPMPMGMAFDGIGRMALGTRRDIWMFHNAPDIAAQLEPAGVHDAAFLPRLCHVTGDVRVHEMAFGQGDLWFINTRFSCLCRLNEKFSFDPVWMPPFVTVMTPEDRCHLSGLAMREGQPRYLTCHGRTDTHRGWKPDRATGGIIMEYPSGQVISEGLAMPHSPRFYSDRLWVLNSGYGELGFVDLPTGQIETVARFPGYARGLALCNGYAFVGLSKIREKREFGGMPLEQWLDQPQCGIHVVDLASGNVVEFLTFTSGAEEIFDVQILPGIRQATLVGTMKNDVNSIFVVPPRWNAQPPSPEALAANQQQAPDPHVDADESEST